MHNDTPSDAQQTLVKTPGQEPWREVLRQVVSLMRALSERGETGSVDLLAHQLDDGDYLTLREYLGEGELYAVLGEDSVVELVQTAHAGVWWVTYRDEQGDMFGDFIEVAYCPEALIPAPNEVRESMAALQARMFASDNQGLLPYEEPE